MERTTKLTVLVLPALCLAALGCGGPSEPERERRLGVIWLGPFEPQIEVPDTVPSGQAFRFSVVTYGNSCVARGDTEVESEAMRVVAVPYDLHEKDPVGCADLLHVWEHVALGVFSGPGTGELVVRGLRDTLIAEPDTIEVVRTVSVE